MTKAPKELTVEAQAKALNLSVRRVSQLRLEGMPRTLAESRAWRRERMAITPDFAAARARKMTADAARSELALAVAKGDLVEREHCDGEARHIALAVRGALLELESALPGKLLGLQNYGQIRQLLHNELAAVLTKLHTGEFFRTPGVLEAVRQFHPTFTPTDEAER